MYVTRYISIFIIGLLFCTTSFATPDSTKKAEPSIKKATPAKKAEPVAKKKTPPAKPQKTGEQKVLGGFISTIDASKNIVTVLLKSKEYPFLVETSTAIVAGNQKITFKDLKKGDRITIKYFRYNDGKRRAEHINNKSYKPPQAKKKAVPEKKPGKTIKKEDEGVKRDKVLPVKPKPDTTKKK